MKTVTRKALALAAMLAAGSAFGADRYTCKTADGIVSRDRSISDCIGPQKKNGIEMAPALTPKQAADQKEIERLRAIEEQKRLDAIRADEQFLAEFPDEATLQTAREADLAPLRGREDDLRKRLAALAVQRVPLTKEAQFYKTEAARPQWLKDAFATNDAQVEATNTGFRKLEQDVSAVNAKRDGELERLRRLRAGAAPGSLATATAGSVPPGRN